MEFNPEVLTSLATALSEYTGDKYLEYLNISYNKIKNEGLEILA